MTDGKVIDVDFVKKEIITEENKEYIPGFNKRKLELITLRTNFLIMFGETEDEIIHALSIMADLTRELSEYSWFEEANDFFEEFVRTNPHWHFSAQQKKSSKKILVKEYWGLLYNSWKKRKK